jgi:ribosomal protein L11 methyltransferase
MDASLLTRIDVDIPETLADSCEAFLADKTPQGWEEQRQGDRVRYRLHLEHDAVARELLRQLADRFPEAEIATDQVQIENWAMAWKDFFQPVACGQTFEIVPPWLKDKGHGDYTTIVIEPKMAFGTGHHPTTSLCLAVLGDLAAMGRIGAGSRFLDLGTGSGILGIAMGMLGLTGLGADIDPQAVACARENLEANNVADRMDLVEGSIDNLPGDERFDVIAANILSGPLIRMAPYLVRRLADGGCLILSGILDEQADAVAQAYMRQGMPEPERRVDGEWAALIWS